MGCVHDAPEVRIGLREVINQGGEFDHWGIADASLVCRCCNQVLNINTEQVLNDLDRIRKSYEQ